MMKSKPSRPMDDKLPKKAPVAKAQASQSGKPSKLTAMKAAKKKERA